MIGRSVRKGAIATFIPSLALCFKVCVMTSASRGPGAIPADNPKTRPAVKAETMLGSFFL
jgi:hypothetical protein